MQPGVSVRDALWDNKGRGQYSNSTEGKKGRGGQYSDSTNGWDGSALHSEKMAFEEADTDM